MTVEEINRIACVDDDGTPYEVRIFQEFTRNRTLTSSGTVPGMKFAVLSGGRKLNYVGDDELDGFVIVETGKILKPI